MNYSALVIAYHRSDLVDDILRQLGEQSAAPRRIMVVDNGGDVQIDGGRVPVGTELHVVRRSDNPGYGAAVNEARALLGDGEELLVLTHDAVFGADLAERLLEALDGHPELGAVAPVLHRASDPRKVFSAGGVLRASGRAFHRATAPSASPGYADWLDGAIVLFRTDALDRIGWIDEDYFLYFEDVDTGWRMQLAGFRSAVVADLIAYQEPGAHPAYLGIRNMALFAQKSGIPRARSARGIIRRMTEVSAGALLHRKRPPLGAMFRGWHDGLAQATGKPAR